MTGEVKGNFEGVFRELPGGATLAGLDVAQLTTSGRCQAHHTPHVRRTYRQAHLASPRQAGLTIPVRFTLQVVSGTPYTTRQAHLTGRVRGALQGVKTKATRFSTPRKTRTRPGESAKTRTCHTRLPNCNSEGDTSMITLVVGPPTGGKSTWVRDHAQPGDVIVDFDTIAQTLGSPVTHDHPDHIVAITLEAHQAALRAIW